MMCGLLLARAGIDVWVLEKHKDFLRDFRGDTVHPSTLQIMDELGLLDKFLALPHDEVHEISAEFGKESFKVADMSRLPTRAKFVALMPQWDFLDFLAAEARRYPTFHLAMEAEVTELLAKGNRIVGVRVKTPVGSGDLLARLVIGADGRRSTVRAKAKLKVTDLGAPFDVLWLRLPVEAGDPHEPVGRFVGGNLFVMLYRGDYWQCALLIPKGGFAALKAEGLQRLPVAAAHRGGVCARPGRDDPELRRRQVAHREGRQADALGAARPRLHRRRSACDVAGRRRRHQPRDPGRGGGGEHPEPDPSAAYAEPARPGARAEAPRISDAGGAALPGTGAECGAGAVDPPPGDAAAALAALSAGSLAMAAAMAGAVPGDRRQARAHPLAARQSSR